MRSRKRPCQPKTAKRIFGGPGSHGPSGQAKEQMRILPVRRGFSAPGAPRRLPGLAAFSKPAAVWPVGFCARCPGVFSASAACARGILWRCLSCLPAVPLCAQFRLVLAVCLPVPCWLHARFSLIFYLLPFPVWLVPRKLLFLCRSGRDGDSLACPLPRLCSRPVWFVTCCFFADFCAHCLFFRSALFMRVFPLVFLPFPA